MILSLNVSKELSGLGMGGMPSGSTLVKRVNSISCNFLGANKLAAS